MFGKYPPFNPCKCLKCVELAAIDEMMALGRCQPMPDVDALYVPAVKPSVKRFCDGSCP